jgi:TolB protein
MISNPSSLRAANVTNGRQTGGYPVRWSKMVLCLLLLAAAPALVRAQGRGAGGAANSDYVIFVSQRTGATELYLLDLETRAVGALTSTGRGHITPAVAAGARVAAYASREGSSYELYTAEISSAWRTRLPQFSAVTRLTVDAEDQTAPTLTADGRLMAFSAKGGIELMSAEGQNRRVLVAPDAHFNFSPAISPDGKQVAFVSNRTGASELWAANTATGELRQLTTGAEAQAGLSWSADSRQIVFTTTATASKLSGIALADAATGSFRVLTDGGDGDPAMAPNGTRVIFTSVRDGDAELYLLDLATNSVQRLTNNPGLDGAAVFVPAPVGATRRDTLPTRRGSVQGRSLEKE